MASKKYDSIDGQIHLFSTIAAPGFTLSSSSSERSVKRGEATADFYKNIDGYRVNWGKMQEKFSWNKTGVFTNTANQIDVQENQDQTYYYNPFNNQKVACFFPEGDNSLEGGVEEDLVKMSEIKNSVGEMAISFDKPYSTSELQKILPTNLIPTFYWAYAPKLIQSNGIQSYMPLGVNSTDAENGTITQLDWEEFYTNIKTVNEKNAPTSDVLANAKLIKKQYAGKKLSEVNFGGVLLTGKTESFEQLKGKSWVRASSGGAVIYRSPFIEPTK
jgi:hypothetical protein